MFNSLSGRFLVLTILFVMLAEVFIFVPSIARFRQDYMTNRLERAQIASLALLADDMIDPDLETELLKNAGVYNVVLRRDEMRELVLNSDLPSPVAATFDLRDPSSWSLIRDAISCLADPSPRVVRVIGQPVQDAGLLIEITMPTQPLRMAMLDYGLRILALSAVISFVTASLLFFAVRQFLVKPIKGVVSAMKSYAAAPEDARRIIQPSASVRELAEAETALQSMQTDLTSMLRQRERLASLGSAVAKVSHDLRNILASAQLFADRIETSEDPAVARLAPKLVNSIGRAVNLCEFDAGLREGRGAATGADAGAVVGSSDRCHRGREVGRRGRRRRFCRRGPIRPYASCRSRAALPCAIEPCPQCAPGHHGQARAGPSYRLGPGG